MNENCEMKKTEVVFLDFRWCWKTTDHIWLFHCPFFAVCPSTFDRRVTVWALRQHDLLPTPDNGWGISKFPDKDVACLVENPASWQ